jgi:Uma2 family endonuclease
MSTTTRPPISVPEEQRLVLYNVDWGTYQRLLHDLDGRHLRLNYDRGRLEIMTTSSRHERWKTLLARFFEVLTEELNVPILGLGSFTFQREDLDRGLEPDECWYIAHEADVRDREEIDLEVDPPPDLVVEIEVSRSVIDRLSLLAALGVPEIWRFDGERLVVMRLNEAGRYEECEQSPTFPQLPLTGLVEHLQLRGQIDETTLIRAFRKWARETIVAKSPNSQP